MYPSKTKILYLLIPAGLIIALAISFYSSGKKSKLGGNIDSTISFANYRLPEKLDFAGEPVLLDSFDVSERMDREFYKNLYFHSATTMEIKRAGRWKPVILPILKENGIPEDFFYLCVAESQLLNATSPAGAKGFWQFMEASGREYGLLVNDQVDERLDVAKATVAACKLLNDAHKKFGNWTLAAASYNMGMTGLKNEMERQKVGNYYDLLLNAETAAYIFRVIAIKYILQDPKKYGYNLNESEIYQPTKFPSVMVSENIPDLVDWSLNLESNYKMVRLANPWILSDKLDAIPGKPWKIYFPVNIPKFLYEMNTRNEKVDSIVVTN